MRTGASARCCSASATARTCAPTYIDWRGHAGWTQSAEDKAYYQAHPVG